MTRDYTKFSKEIDVSLLQALLESKNDPEQYKAIMAKLGESLGDILKDHLDVVGAQSSYLVVTAEDADYLGQGILARIESHNSFKGLACFWNNRTIVPKVGSVAPIIRRYKEPANFDTLIIAKSIISGACVVKTNIIDLLENHNPKRVIIVAPVMHKDSRKKLREEFGKKADNFEFVSFAIDGKREDNGMVVPGIGGDVYQLLGFKDQDDKNRYTPQLVQNRIKSLTA